MRADTFNSHVETVRTQMTITQKMNISQMNTKNILNLCVCYSGKNESKWIIVDQNLSQFCSTDESESERVIVNESSMEEIESKSVHNIFYTNEVKNSIDETED